MPRGVPGSGNKNKGCRLQDPAVREKAKARIAANRPRKKIERLLKDLESADTAVLDVQIEEHEKELARLKAIRATLASLKDVRPAPTAIEVKNTPAQEQDPDDIGILLGQAMDMIDSAGHPLELHTLASRLAVPKAMLEKLLAKDERFVYSARGYSVKD